VGRYKEPSLSDLDYEAGAAAKAKYARETPPGARIFVWTTRHDKAVGSDIAFRFLADCHSATRYHEPVAGSSTTDAVQRELVADQERYSVRLVVLSAAFDYVEEPNLSRLSSGVTRLDNYIRTRFRQRPQLGVYSV
jgi:hypothetical protein